MSDPQDPRRRRALSALAALPFAAAAASRAGEPSPGAAPARLPAAPLSADWCGSDRPPPAPLLVPADRGYLGRLAPGGAPVTLRAARAPRLPPAVVHGPLAFRALHDGREYVNPTLAFRPGERARIDLVNDLAEPTIVHWHGLANATKDDGAGFDVVRPGATRRYDFEIRDRAALYWYHPHPHGRTATQAHDGLFGLLQVDDDDDAALRRALDLEPGVTEIPLVFRDLHDAGHAESPAERAHGRLGHEMYVNGRACAVLDVASRLYRFRLLNGCNARTLMLAFRTAGGGTVPCTLVGNDGGLLSAPRAVDVVFVATAERLDLLVDLRDAPLGEAIVLYTLDFDPMQGVADRPVAKLPPMRHGEDRPAGKAPRAGGGTPWPEGALRALLQLRVRERVRYDRAIPARLAAVPPLDTAGARTRSFRLGFNKGRWRINDKVFAMNETPIELARDTTEVWLLRNYHTSMPHAMHLHGFRFEVLERETSPEFVGALAADARGRLPTDLGQKDTLLIWPGESLRVAIRFALPFPGPQRYLFHCHNLEHEDGGMMLGVMVT